MSMLYMICYDIVEDAKRERTRKTLSEYGERIQYSLFECALGGHELEELRGKLKEIVDARTDSVRFYPLCSACAEKVIIEGGSPMDPDEGFVIV
jgi:CRISPR-associated protein Cas2